MKDQLLVLFSLGALYCSSALGEIYECQHRNSEVFTAFLVFGDGAGDLDFASVKYFGTRYRSTGGLSDFPLDDGRYKHDSNALALGLANNSLRFILDTKRRADEMQQIYDGTVVVQAADNADRVFSVTCTLDNSEA